MATKATLSTSTPSTNVGESVQPGVENSPLNGRTQSVVQDRIFGVKNLCIPDNGTVPVLPDAKVFYSEKPKPEFCPPKFLTE